MLVDNDEIMRPDPILRMMCAMDGKPVARHVETGVYEVGHFGMSNFLRGYTDYPDLESIGCYGVCDSLEQIKAQCPEIADPSRQFTITLTEVRKDEQPSDGGWRWHKWGEYIGDHEPQREYLHDEPNIDRVYVYHIYERE